MLEYNSAVFDVSDIQHAKSVILTREGERSTDDRWRAETPYLLSLIDQHLGISSDSVVLDYGCGIGRMSKAMIEKYGCRVVGVDISPSMRALAAAYVSSDKFFACAPEMLSLGIKFDEAIAVWVLQHCNQVEEDVARIHKSMNPGGGLFVVNDRNRLVPTNARGGWANDGKNVREILKKSFAEEVDCELDAGKIGAQIVRASYCSVMSRGR